MLEATGSEIITELLMRKGIRVVAGIPGGANLPLYHALSKSPIRHVLARQEQAAGFIAQGIARTTGKAAVCLATSGPGATNLLTAIADAKLDSVPIIAITGQVPTSLIGTDAFQEVDTYGMSVPITKHNFLVRSAEELLTVIPLAFQIAEEGRPGPVLIDVPKDVQKAIAMFPAWPTFDDAKDAHTIDEDALERAREMIAHAERPVIIAGAGIIHANASDALQAFAEKTNIPVAMTLLGLGAYPSRARLSLGMLGMHGSRATNYILHEADLIIALGMRFDDRATGQVDGFCPHAKVIHVDIDASEHDKIRKAECAIKGDVRDALSFLAAHCEGGTRRAWEAYITKIETRYPRAPKAYASPHAPFPLLHALAEAAGDDAIIATDVGQHQMWTAQAYPFTKPRTFLTSGGLGTMGFGFPTALGAALANPTKKTICISGDGSFLMNIQELATLREEGAPVAIVLFNNGTLGLVRQQQELFYDKNYIASLFRATPDFCAIAHAFGIRSARLEAGEDPKAFFARHLADASPVLLDIPVTEDENVFPMVAPGSANTTMIGGNHDA